MVENIGDFSNLELNKGFDAVVSDEVLGEMHKKEKITTSFN